MIILEMVILTLLYTTFFSEVASSVSLFFI